MLDMFHKGPDHFLGTTDLIQVIVRFCKKFPQPFPPAYRAGKVQLMKYGELLFRMEDGDVVEGCVVDLHNLKKEPRCQDTKMPKEDPRTKIPRSQIRFKLQMANNKQNILSSSLQALGFMFSMN